MLVLAFDTATPAVTVALVELRTRPDDGTGLRIVSEHEMFRVRASRTEIGANRHEELLAPLIADVLRAGGATATDLTAVAVGDGPGPFTGLRVGLVTAAALADGLGVPAYAACSLDVIAHRHAEVGEFLVVTDARRREVYWAHYGESGVRLAGPAVDRPADVAERFRDRPLRVVGAGALLHRDAFAGFELDDGDPYPRAADLARLVQARVRAGAPADQLTPRYLRRPDAAPPAAPKPVLR